MHIFHAAFSIIACFNLNNLMDSADDADIIYLHPTCKKVNQSLVHETASIGTNKAKNGGLVWWRMKEME